MTIRPAGPGHGQTYPFGQRPLPHRGANGRAPRRTATVRWLKATGGGVLTPAFAVKALFVAAVASATVYLLGQPGADEQLSGEISDTTVWSDRALEVPDPLATEAERMRAETAVVPVFVQDDGVAERIMDGARRVFRAGRGLAEQNPDSLPDALTDEFIADFYAVFHAAGAGDAARSAEAAAPGTGAPGPSGGDLLASAADGAGPAASAGGAVAVPFFLGGFRLPAPAVAESPAGVAWAGAAPVPGRPGGTHPPAAGEDEGPAGDGRDGSPAGDARDGSPAGDAALTVVEDSGTGPDADPGAAAPAAPGHAAAAPPDSPASRASRQAAREPADARARGHRAGPQDGEPAPAAAAGALVRRAAADGFTERLERAVTILAMEVLIQGLLEEFPESLTFQGRQVTLARPGARAVGVGFDSFLTLSRARSYLAPRAAMQAADTSSDAGLITDLVMGAVRPNVRLDRDNYLDRLGKAMLSVPPVIYKVRRGELVVQEGETITPRTELILRALAEGRDTGYWVKRSAGLLVILLVFVSITQAVASMDRRRLSGAREPVFMAALLMMYIFMAWASVRLGEGFEKGFGLAHPHTLFLAMPMPTAAMLAVIFLGNRRAVPVAFMGSILAAALSPLDTFESFVYLANGSLVAILHLRHISERGRFISSSVMCALANVLTSLGISLMDGRPPVSYDLLAGVVSGLLSGILASGLVPLAELLMGFTTNLKLMELGNLNRPLLRELMLAAPGTYHHSVIVGSMVEAAAEAIGANPHLARVGAYYHDIGKIRKPLYFIENQAGENRHDSLTPTMSVLILVGHVKDGVEIARAHNLPPEVIDIVEQHHGTSLMSFFLHKAIENRSPNSPPVNPGDFRYPGPKPASKEAGLVMLADICEAATRSLTEPTPAKIQELVRALVNRIFDDGQLEASELVLRDLTETKKIFTNILVGIYHHRVTYPVLSKDAVNNQAARSKVIYGTISQEPAGKRVTH